MKVIKKNIILIIFIVIIVLVILSTLFFKVRKDIIFENSYVGQQIQKIKEDEVGIKSISKLGIADSIAFLFYDDAIWEKLPLSSNFKNKYEKRLDLINNINEYDNFFARRDSENNNRIILLGIKKANILDAFNEYETSTEFYFEYILDENNEIDDLKLIKKNEINSTTGEIIS